MIVTISNIPYLPENWSHRSTSFLPPPHPHNVSHNKSIINCQSISHTPHIDYQHGSDASSWRSNLKLVMITMLTLLPLVTILLSSDIWRGNSYSIFSSMEVVLPVKLGRRKFCAILNESVVVRCIYTFWAKPSMMKRLVQDGKEEQEYYYYWELAAVVRAYISQWCVQYQFNTYLCGCMSSCAISSKSSDCWSISANGLPSSS